MKEDKPIPPALATRFLNWFLRDDLAEEVEGDLQEQFTQLVREQSLNKARLYYWYEVFNYLRPFALRKSSSLFNNNYDMLENYFKIGWRNITKQKMYSSLKVGGFAVGIAACILIALFIIHETSYDRHYANGHRIFRVVEKYNDKGMIKKGVHLPAPTGQAIKEDLAEVEAFARLNPVELFGAGSNDIRRDDQAENTHEEGFAYADPAFLKLFDVPFIYGSAEHALKDPNTIVITKKKAQKYFPGVDPVGKIMIINNDTKNPYKVGGVIEYPNRNAHFKYDFLITLSGKEFYPGEQTNWLANNYPTYLLLREGVDAKQTADKLGKLLGEKYYLPRLLEQGYPDAKNAVKNLSYELQPVSDIYLGTEGFGDHLNHGDKRFTYLSGALALFILLIACINFINLSTAKSANRAKEVGLRKVVGSMRNNLINQFLSESLLFSLLSFVIGFCLAVFLLPFFNSLTGKSIDFPWTEWRLYPILLMSSIIVGFIAGLYPSFYLSSFRPIEVLKGNVSRGSKSSYTRSLLVIFQFTTSIILIIGTFIIYRQMNHILTTKIGFDKEQVLVIQGTNLLGDKIATFKNELTGLPDVQSATVSDYLPVQGTKRNGNGFWLEGRKETDQHIGAQFWLVDHDYLKTMGIKLVEGRNFSVDMPTDSGSIIINQAMAKELNLTDPVGKRIENYRGWNVIGVCENFNYESLRSNVGPLAMVLGNSPSIISVKINSNEMSGAISQISALWKRFAPQQPIRYTFLNESFAKMYEDVQRMGKIFTSFAAFALLVACLGLFGLSSFMVEQRSKEISIRLVMGASIKNIFGLLTQNFVKLVIISFLIAAPTAWYVMEKWLQDFAYRTQITADVFLLTAFIALTIALLTISYQALHAAMVKPVDKLRSE